MFHHLSIPRLGNAGDVGSWHNFCDLRKFILPRMDDCLGIWIFYSFYGLEGPAFRLARLRIEGPNCRRFYDVVQKLNKKIDSPQNKAFLKKWLAKYKDAPVAFRYPNLSMGRCYWGVRFMAEAVKKAGTADVDAVIKAWEGMSYEVPWGTVTMRACDHQIITPGVVAEVMPTSEFYDFPYVGKPMIIPAEEITTPPELTGNPRCK